MSKSYKGVRLKKHRVYSVDDLIDAYSATRNTVTNWVKAGLQPSDDKKPYVFKGEVVIGFHRDRRARSIKQLRPGEFKCFGCTMAVFPVPSTVVEDATAKGAVMLIAACSECRATVMKRASEADLEVIRQLANPNTTTGRRHEQKQSGLGGIVIPVTPNGSRNDRTIYAWQRYAGRASEKTIDRHLAAIRFFISHIDDRAMRSLSVADVAKVRDVLKERGRSQDIDSLSRSTVTHYASHMRAFLEWLIKQKEFAHLPKDLPDYMELPKGLGAASLPSQAKLAPTLEEAEYLLRKMPSRTLLDRRQRAIFALAFLGALRADTLVSLRLKHVIVSEKLVLQNSSESRTKNGKSFRIAWFPVPELFGTVVTDWVLEMNGRGFQPDDALFPANDILESATRTHTIANGPIPPMSSKHAVQNAFKSASKDLDVAYSPHSAKHAIGRERDRRQLTNEQRKAWSLNMGHERETTTDSNYAKIGDERRFELMQMPEASNTTARFTSMTNEEKVALVDSIAAKLLDLRWNGEVIEQ